MSRYRVSLSEWPYVVEIECDDPDDIRAEAIRRARNIDGCDLVAIADAEVEDIEDLTQAEKDDGNAQEDAWHAEDCEADT